MNAAPTLTDRYITAAERALPRGSQEDLRDELAASIADAVDARTEQGEEPEAAERAVLTDLGDPLLLAARYADRPVHLIGPRFFASWWRLLKVLLAIVPACVLAGMVLATAIEGAGPVDIVLRSIGVTITATIHLCFWITLVFAILERVGADAPAWDLDSLPEDAAAQVRPRLDLAVGLVLLALLAGALLWDGLVGFVRFDGEREPFLNPGLWPGAMTVLFVLLALDAVLLVVLRLRGRWSTGAAIARSLIGAGVISWILILLGRAELMNPVAVELLVASSGEPDLPRILGVVTAFFTAGVGIWIVIDAVLRARRGTPA